ncbi:MAG: hypothetical protein ABEI77_03450 [Halorientalis sp.]
MVDVTLLELHLEDASFTANAPFSSESTADSEGAGDESEQGATAVPIGEDHSDGGPSKLLLAVMGLGVVGALGWWLKRGQLPDIDEEIEVAP